MKILPIVAYSLFEKDFPNLTNKAQVDYYYKEQCAMKFIFGVKSTIKFIKE